MVKRAAGRARRARLGDGPGRPEVPRGARGAAPRGARAGARRAAVAARVASRLATRLVWTARGDEIPDAALAFVMGELEVASRRALRGHRRRRSSSGGPRAASPDRRPSGSAARRRGAAYEPGRRTRRARPGGPRRRSARCARPAGSIALFGLGPRGDGRAFSPEDIAFLESLAATAATPIEGGPRRRGAAARQPRPVRQGVPAPEPVRHRPRAGGDARRGRDRAAGGDDA